MAILWFMLDPATSRAAVSECICLINLVRTTEIINSVFTKFPYQISHVLIFISSFDCDFHILCLLSQLVGNHELGNIFEIDFGKIS